MSRTRLEIKALVHSHTNRTKETLENSLCDSALKIAQSRHPFQDSQSNPEDFTIDEDATYVDVSSASILHIVTARIVEADGSRNAPLKMKNKTWWDKKVVNAEDNMKSWPVYGLKDGDCVRFNCPVSSGLELRLRITTVQTFTDDSTECPIKTLDIFVEKYVTAEVFLDVGNHEKYLFWRAQALGPNYDRGEVGGELLNAINADKFANAEEYEFDRDDVLSDAGIAMRNLISGHERYGEIDYWL